MASNDYMHRVNNSKWFKQPSLFDVFNPPPPPPPPTADDLLDMLKTSREEREKVFEGVR